MSRKPAPARAWHTPPLIDADPDTPLVAPRLSTRGLAKQRAGSAKGMDMMLVNGHTAGKNAKRSASARAKFVPVSLAKVRLPGGDHE